MKSLLPCWDQPSLTEFIQAKTVSCRPYVALERQYIVCRLCAVKSTISRGFPGRPVAGSPAMQCRGPLAPSLVQEDPTCHRTTRPMGHNYWAHMLKLLKPVCLKVHAPQQEKPLQWEARTPQLESSHCSPQLEKAYSQQWRFNTAKIINKEYNI